MSETSSGIVRAPRPDSNYTQIRNEVLRDQEISYRARGLLAAILSRPDNWRTTAESLARDGGEGRKAILTALKELETSGYLVRSRKQDPTTGRWSTSSIVFDTPQLVTEVPLPNVGEPTVGEPTVGQSDANRTLEKNTREEERTTPALAGEVVEAQVVTAQKIVGEYVDAFSAAYAETPPARNIGRLAREARMLLDEGKRPDLLLEAARKCADEGHVNLPSAYSWILAQPNRDAARSTKESATSLYLRAAESLGSVERKEIEG